MRIRYFKILNLKTIVALVITVSVIGFTSGATNAQNAINSLSGDAPLEAAKIDDAFKDILNNSQSKSLKRFGEDAKWLTKASKGLSKEHTKAIDDVIKKSTKNAGIDRIKSQKPFSTIVFVSYSMPNNELVEIMSQVAGDQEALIVMRGIPEGYTITDGIRVMQQLAGSFETAPNIALDPTAFKKYNINAVPSIVLLEKDEGLKSRFFNTMPTNQQEAFQMLSEASKNGLARDSEYKDNNSYLAKVVGISNISWLKEQVKNGNTGDLGKRGPSLDISEPDLIEVMKEKITQIDWNEKRENAIKNYWPGRSYLSLPQAHESRTRRIDASVVVTDDIKTPSGKFIAKKGDRVNPLATRPFTQAIVIFDARSEKQIEAVLNNMNEIKAKEGVQKIVFIASAMDNDKGWTGFKDLTERLDNNLFVLTPDIRERFQIERVPSVITADDTHFIVQELPVELVEKKQQFQVSSDKQNVIRIGSLK